MRNSASYGGLHHAELRTMRNSASYGTLHAIFRIMRNSASCGTPHHAELCIMRNSTCYFPQRIGSLCGKVSQYSASMRNSALDFRFLRSIGTNFPLHAELCSIGIFAELGKMWKNYGEFSASNIFHFLNLFHYIFRMMWKCCPNTPQEISASKLAENDGFCGNLRYGRFGPVHLCIFVPTVKASLLKFHIWIPHKKIAYPYFFFPKFFSHCGVMAL